VDRSFPYQTQRNDAPKDEKLVIEPCDKIDIARILMERIDGVVAQARVSTLSLADTVLERWASDVPEAGEGQCQIQIIFEDGFQYRSQFGLIRSPRRISLAKVLRQQLTIMASPDKRPRKRKERTGPITAIAQPSLSLNADAMLARYDI